MKSALSSLVTSVCTLVALVALTGPAVSQAQDEAAPAPDLHPLLTNRFRILAGAFFPEKGFKLRADGTVPGEDIEFDEVFRFEDSDVTGMIDFNWRFGEKWSLGLEAWDLDNGGGATLTEDIVWDDLIFREGTFVNAGVDLTVARVFFGRRLWSGDTWETGLGGGFHWLEMGAFIEGEIRINDDTTEVQRGDVDAAFPMPNLGVWYLHSLSPRWALSARLDWLDVSIDRYSGALWNAQAGVYFQAWENVGFALHGAYFELDGRIKEADWRGQVELKQYGPRASLYVNF